MAMQFGVADHGKGLPRDLPGGAVHGRTYVLIMPAVCERTFPKILTKFDETRCRYPASQRHDHDSSPDCRSGSLEHADGRNRHAAGVGPVARGARGTGGKRLNTERLAPGARDDGDDRPSWSVRRPAGRTGERSGRPAGPRRIGGDGVLLYPRHVIPRRPLLLAGVVLLVVACSGRAGIDDPLQSALEATPGETLAVPSKLPSLPAVPETDKPTATEELAVSQTDTEWGRIWDAPGQLPGLPACSGDRDGRGGEPVSATSSSAAAADEARRGCRGSSWRPSARWRSRTTRGRQLVLDSVGDDDCRAETNARARGVSRSSRSVTGRTARSNSVAPTQHTEPNRRP